MTSGDCKRSAQDCFELDLYGGGFERQYRKACPEVEALPWDAFGLAAFDPEPVRGARLSWTKAALQEYASVFFHAQVQEDMVRARMPLDLIAMISRFQLEEVVHAEIAGRFAMTLGGGAQIAFDPDRSAPRARNQPGRSPLLDLAERATWTFCVSETFSHAMLNAAFQRAQHPLLKALRGVFAKDEAAHGRFGWVLLEMLLPEIDDAGKARLREVAKSSMDKLLNDSESAVRLSKSSFGEISTLGPFEPEEYRELALRMLDQRVRQRLAALDLA
jgi:hypothetical protein